MKTDRVYVELSYTKNLGNYQSLKLTAGLELVPDNETTDELFQAGWNEVKEQINTQLKEIVIEK